MTSLDIICVARQSVEPARIAVTLASICNASTSSVGCVHLILDRKLSSSTSDALLSAARGIVSVLLHYPPSSACAGDVDMCLWLVSQPLLRSVDRCLVLTAGSLVLRDLSTLASVELHAPVGGVVDPLFAWAASTPECPHALADCLLMADVAPWLQLRYASWQAMPPMPPAAEPDAVSTALQPSLLNWNALLLHCGMLRSMMPTLARRAAAIAATTTVGNALRFPEEEAAQYIDFSLLLKGRTQILPAHANLMVQQLADCSVTDIDMDTALVFTFEFRAWTPWFHNFRSGRFVSPAHAAFACRVRQFIHLWRQCLDQGPFRGWLPFKLRELLNQSERAGPPLMPAPMPVHLISYGDDVYAARRDVFRAEATAFGLFESVTAMGPSDLDSHFWETHGDFVRKNERGGGYWLWKPYIIERELRRLSDGAVLAYVDLGCTINSAGRQRFHEYLQLVCSNAPHIIGAVTPDPRQTDARHCKPDLLARLGIEINGSIGSSRQIRATFVLARKSSHSMRLVQKWLELCAADEYHLLDDSPSIFPPSREFHEHRHDQAILSVLLKLAGAAVVEDDINAGVAMKDWTTVSHLPLLATRLTRPCPEDSFWGTLSRTSSSELDARGSDHDRRGRDTECGIMPPKA